MCGGCGVRNVWVCAAWALLLLLLPLPLHLPGFPVFAAQPHLERLVRAGERVALCEQMTDVEAGSGLLRRCVTRVVTPGAGVSHVCVRGRCCEYEFGSCVRPRELVLSTLLQPGLHPPHSPPPPTVLAVWVRGPPPLTSVRRHSYGG